MKKVDYQLGQELEISGLLCGCVGDRATFIRQLTDEENQKLLAPYIGGNGVLIKVDNPEYKCCVDLPDVGPGVIVASPNSVRPLEEVR
jgi:hypothetical protein